MLGIEADLRVVGTGDSVARAIDLHRTLQPDVVLLDVHLPDGSGVEAAAQIKRERPQTQVVILTSDEDERVLQAAIQAGVTGYLSKHEAAPQVLQAVRSAASGEALIAPYMLARLLRGLERPQQTQPPASPLTPKELVVLRELALGHDNESVAKTLGLSPNTVRTHVQNILAKIKVHSKLEAVSKALQEGWISLPREQAA